VSAPHATRRVFLDQALAAVSVVALAEVLPGSTVSAAAPPTVVPPLPTCLPNGVPVPGSVNLRCIGEIRSVKDKLKAVITVRNRLQDVPTGTGQNTNTMMLRYYEGHVPGSTQQWPTAATVPGKQHPLPGPGPTLHCKLGDTVQLALINAVDTAAFPRTLDLLERGLTDTGCDTVRSSGPPPGFVPPTPAPGGTPVPTPQPAHEIYPSNDKFPDCLHGSSSANIHFHGTHVTPATTGDNVLNNVLPGKNLSERDILAMFAPIWDHCTLGHQPHVWTDLPPRWRAYQEKLLRNHDATSEYKGKNGNLPRDQWLWPQNEAAIKSGQWPQWYIGSSPYCFQIPPAERDGKPVNLEMGQAPGTHWYHSHKHGSTAINMFNGMSGALIIRDPHPDGYDEKLHAFYQKQNRVLTEIVLVFQQITDTPNLLTNRGVAGRAPTLVNGQFAPTITMQPGQVQLWRMINACVANVVPAGFQLVTGSGTTLPTPPPSPAPGPNPAVTYKQTAQDGVQFPWQTFSTQDTIKNPVSLAPANRADLLVQAPNVPGMYVMQDAANGNPVLYVNVLGTVMSPPMGFPATEGDFPKRPNFLNDIDPVAPDTTVRLHRDIVYGWKNIPRGRRLPDKSKNINPRTGYPILPEFTINDRQFTDGRIDEVMLLGTTEEWTIANATTNIAHPFHIHINPFQIFEVFDPSADPVKPIKITGPLIWWDTFAIPPGVVVTNPTLDPRTGRMIPAGGILPGYFKMRTRFVDFTGMYVQHCHILTHEDRGMMQLLEVVSNKTILKHH
jgi:FtsP/CotA-like multicopper oxidase with cupredoxin domain